MKDEVIARFKTDQEGGLSLTLKAGGMTVHFSYSPEAVASEAAMLVGMKAIHSVISTFSGEKAADDALREFLKRLEPTGQN